MKFTTSHLIAISVAAIAGCLIYLLLTAGHL